MFYTNFTCCFNFQFFFMYYIPTRTFIFLFFLYVFIPTLQATVIVPHIRGTKFVASHQQPRNPVEVLVPERKLSYPKGSPRTRRGVLVHEEESSDVLAMFEGCFKEVVGKF